MFKRLNPVFNLKPSVNKRLFSDMIHSVKFNLLMPNLQQKEIIIDRNKTFKDIEDEVKKDNTHTTLEFRTWDYSIISKANDIDSSLNTDEPLFVKVGSMEWQLLNKEKNETIELQTEKHRLKEDFSHDARKELESITNKVRALNKNNLLTQQDLDKIALDLFKIKKSYYSESVNDTMSQFRNLTDMFESYYKLKSEFAKLSMTKSELLNQCGTKAKLLIALGGLLFVTELILIYYGVFIQYSWDIVEPMTYLVGCANFVLILYYRKKLGNLSAHQYYTQKFFNKIVKRKKFNEELYFSTEKKIKEIEKVFNR